MQAFRALAAVVAAGTLAAGALAAGCGARPAPHAPAGATRSAPAGAARSAPAGTARSPARTARSAATVAAAPTAAGNDRLARREARRLLALVRVPGGAVPLPAVPRSVPAASTPEVASLADQARAWRLALPETRAVAWLRVHPPPGLPLTLTGSGTETGGAPDSELGYAGPSSPAWASAQLEVEVVAAPGGTSVLRADGQVVWLDPVPLRDSSAGPRMRVTVAGGCPGRDARFIGVPPRRVYESSVANHGADLGRRLLPAPVPTGGLECRYYGGNGPAFRLRSATRLDAAQARRLAAAMTARPLSHTDGGVTGCPFDDGAAEVVALSYPHRGDVDLWIKLNGCAFVSNGYILAGGS
ncbi:MAG TPA: hypothetical protein VGM79_14065 [Streptosporangiaceae bacterium]